MFETMVQGVVYHDDEGKVVSVNPAAEEILGVTLEQIQGRTSMDPRLKAIHEDGSDFLGETHPAMIALKKGKEINDVVMGIFNPKKEGIVWTNIHAIPLFRPNEKKPYMVYTTIENVTEKRKAREDLVREKTYINALIDSLPGIFYVFDDHGRFIHWNKTMEDVSGYSGEEIVELGPAGFFSEEDGRMLIEKIRRVLQGEKADEEADFITKSGEKTPFLLTGARAVIDETTYIVGVGIDQSERKETQKVLSEYQRMLSTLMSNLPGIVYRCKNDRDWTMLFLSDGCKRITGYDSRDLVESATVSFGDIIHPDDRDYVRDHVQLAFDESRPFEFEYRIKTKAGEEKWVWEQGVGLHGDNNENILEGYITDISVIKKTERNLRESRDDWENIFQAIGDPVFILDTDHKIMDANLSALSLFQKTLSEMKGRHCFEFCHGLNRPARGCPLDNLLYTKKHEKQVMEMEVLDKTFLVSCTPIFSDNDIAKVIHIASDITQQKQIESALRDSEERFQTFVENINDVIFSIDASGRVTYLSPVFERIVKFRKDEIIGQDFTQFVCPDDLPELLESFKRTLEGDVEPHEFRVVDKDGSTIYVRSSSRTLYKDGELVGITGSMSDITERKKMQQKLIQTEKLSSLGGILSGVAHELNNPLAAIIGFSELLTRMDLPEDVIEKLNLIMAQSKRSAKIIKSLLTFAREHKPERKMVDVNAVIEDSYNLREYELRTNDIYFRLDIETNLPKTHADPYQLQQVFVNMINNAYDAMKEQGGGSLVIRSLQKDMKIVIQFVDDGPGIPKEHINKIFDPFFTTKEVGQGTGLGLSIVYGIIEEHDGDISVDSRTGEGTTFTIELPIVETEETPAEKKIVRPKKPDKSYSILVVEDEESLRTFLSEALRQEGYDAKTCGNGEEAIDMIENDEFDAVITDIKMPGLSGQNLYTYIQKYHKNIGKRVLFITGDVLGADTRYFFKITGSKYLSKPFELNDLFVMLSEVLDRPSQVPERDLS